MNEELERFSRQAEFVPRDRLCDLLVTIIGVGAVGRQVALQLAAIGVRRLQLVDFDVVDATNVVTQGYRADDVGTSKVHATACAARAIYPQLVIDTVCDRYRPRLTVGEALFCCVDSITARAASWRGAGSRTSFWADGRMLGEVIRVLCATDARGRAHYPATLFAAGEAQTGRCTAHSTVYAAAITAGLLVHQFSRWLRQLPVDLDASVNLLASEWSVLA